MGEASLRKGGQSVSISLTTYTLDSQKLPEAYKGVFDVHSRFNPTMGTKLFVDCTG